MVQVWSLKCKCDICRTTNYTCETDGYCFTSAFIKSGVLQYNYSCLSRAHFFPPEDPLWCHQNATVESTRFCCHNNDYCNAESKLMPLTLSVDKQLKYESS
ncbi:hypothetical protein NQ315_003273, partial [Exocentrus adspersus]